MVQEEIESWFSSDNEHDDTRTQCYKQSCKEYYHYARKMGLQLDDVLKEKVEVQSHADDLYQKRMNTCNAEALTTRSNNVTTHGNTTTKQIEQMYKFKVKHIFECIESLANNNDDDTCPTCRQGDYKKNMSCFPPDCQLCYKWVCTRCGILDDVNEAEANGYLCVHCYKPNLINVDYG